MSSKFLWIATSIAIVGMAGLASADQDQPRRATLQGRQVVWQAPQAEQPYALTGQREDNKAEHQDQLRPQGRAGYVRR